MINEYVTLEEYERRLHNDEPLTNITIIERDEPIKVSISHYQEIAKRGHNMDIYEIRQEDTELREYSLEGDPLVKKFHNKTRNQLSFVNVNNMNIKMHNDFIRHHNINRTIKNLSGTIIIYSDWIIIYGKQYK